MTQAQYEVVMGENLSRWKEPNRPVEHVTWNQAAEFCRLAGERATKREVRLPTEAEWERACRAGSTGRYCFGNDETGLGEYAWFRNNSGNQTRPVGEKRPNAWGLHDMHGNVWEWVADRYGADYYAKSPRENPAGPDTGQRRLLRGGSWNNLGEHCCSAVRNFKAPAYRNNYSGFRVAVSATPLQQSTSARAASTDSGEADLAPPRVRPGEKHVEPIVLLDEADTIPNWKGVKLNTEASKVRKGEASAAWVGGAVILTLPETVPHDWTPYDAITLWIRSQVANGQRVVVTCTSPGPNNNADYFYKRLTVDFAGWKRIALPLADFKRCRSPTGWNDITRLALHIENFVPRLPDTRLWIDCVRLESRGAIGLTRGLVGHWRFDEGTGTTARDSSGRSNHGTVKGGANWAKGRISGALAFDGEDDFVSIPDEADLDITGDITVAAWIKVRAFTKEWQALVTKGDSSWRLHRYCSGTVGRYIGTNRINFDCSGVKVKIFRGATGRVNVNDGRWHHVAGVYDGKTMWLYMNGGVSASTAASGRISVNNCEVRIGENADRTGRHWNG
ncbi:MAG: SUMF1/EgtB/PvdO family nonheme iron enzyme, partial [Planctomycetota bacterium]